MVNCILQLYRAAVPIDRKRINGFGKKVTFGTQNSSHAGNELHIPCENELTRQFSEFNSPSAVKTTLAGFTASSFVGSGVLGLLFEGNDVLAPPFGGIDVLRPLFAGSVALAPLFAESDAKGKLFSGSDALGPLFEEGDALGRFIDGSDVFTAVLSSFGLSDSAPITISSFIFATPLTMVYSPMPRTPLSLIVKVPDESVSFG